MESNPGFGFINMAVLVVYLLFMLVFGSSFIRKSGKSSDAFFKAEGSLPGWAVGMSIFATAVSSITFMSTPEQTFISDWSYIVGSACIIVVIPILIAYFVPFFRKLQVTSAYEYLEERFDPVVRTLSSVLFVLYHLGRISVVVYLPVLAVASVTDINPVLIAVAVSLVCIIYTLLGGMEGVIWSDTIQGFILLAGSILILLMAIFKVDGGLSEITNTIVSEGKFFSASNLDMSDLSDYVPLIFIGQLVSFLYQYGCSQDMVQRFVTSKSMKETKKSLWLTYGLCIVFFPIFYAIGSVLYVYYSQNGGLPAGVNTSAVVPFFILTELPAGIAGLIIAAIFAASQSTVSSSLNSISACLVVDIKRRFFEDKLKNVSEVSIARWIIIVTGLFGLLVTVYFTAGNSSQTWDIILAIGGLFGVPIAAVFTLGIFTKRANGKGTLIGLIAGIVLAIVTDAMNISPLLTATVAFIVTFLIGYFLSLVFPDSDKNIRGLTYKTRDITYGRN